MDLRDWIQADLTAIRTRFAQAIVNLVPRERWTERVPATGPGAPSSSIAGLMLHTTYHRDLALSTAVLDRPPLLATWRTRLGLDACAPELGLAEREATAAVELLDLDALAAYTDAVADTTEHWLSHVATIALETTAPNCRRIEQRAGVRRSEVPWLHDMWDAKPVSWLVQWEMIGHPYSHLGEMIAIRNQLGLSPF